MAARLLRTAAHSLFFMSCSVAITPIKPDFVFTELVFFMAFAVFMAFMAFIAFMGAMVSGVKTSQEQASVHCD